LNWCGLLSILVLPRTANMSAHAGAGSAAPVDPPPLYHEVQRKQLCGLHAVNNLLQRQQFDQPAFDAICEELCPTPSWSNPFKRLLHTNSHKSRWGTGNYDVNICLVSLSQLGFAYRWYDARKAPVLSALMPIRHPRLLGFLVNQAGDGMMSKVTGGRHWFAVRKVPGYGWLNLDSELDGPEQICPERPAGSDAEALTLDLLRSALESGGQVIEIYRTSRSGEEGGEGPPPDERDEPLPSYNDG
jgi:josephin